MLKTLKYIELTLNTLAGSLILCLFSCFQKWLIGMPTLNLKGYIIPFIFGGIAGLAIGIWRKRALKFQDKLKELNKKLEIKVLDRTKALEDLNSTNQKLFSIISHDLRAPLGAQLSACEILIDEFKNMPVAEIYDTIKQLHLSERSIYYLVENLLCWSKAQNTSIAVSPKESKIKPLLENTIDLFKGALEQKEIGISSKIDNDLTAYFDTNLVTTIFRNILNNAIKFTPRNGHILISHTIVEDKVIISIEDSGIGIKCPEKLFNIHSTESTFGTENEKGSGIGLGVCKEFALMNNGDIWIDKTDKEGTIISFSLPKNKTTKP